MTCIAALFKLNEKCLGIIVHIKVKKKVSHAIIPHKAYALWSLPPLLSQKMAIHLKRMDIYFFLGNFLRIETLFQRFDGHINFSKNKLERLIVLNVSK